MCFGVPSLVGIGLRLIWARVVFCRLALKAQRRTDIHFGVCFWWTPKMLVFLFLFFSPPQTPQKVPLERERPTSKVCKHGAGEDLQLASGAHGLFTAQRCAESFFETWGFYPNRKQDAEPCKWASVFFFGPHETTTLRKETFVNFHLRNDI